MSEHYLELVLDGKLSQTEVETAVRQRAEADRITRGSAYDSGGWNNLSVMFRHRLLMGVATVEQARQVIERFDVGDGIAVRVRNDGGLVPLPAATLAEKPRPAAPAPAPGLAVPPAAELVETPAPESPAPEAAMAADEPAAAVDEVPGTPAGPQFEDSEEAKPLLARREQILAKMGNFATEIVQRLGTQTSKTRGCNECKSQISVGYIKAIPGEGAFTTIRCPVCEADNFCIFPTDLAKRETLANHLAKVEAQIADARTAFTAAQAVTAESAEPTSAESAEPTRVGEAAIPEAEPTTQEIAREIANAIAAPADAPAESLEAEPIPAAVAEAESLPHAEEPNTLDEDEAPQAPPEYIWLVGGYVRTAAVAA